MSEIYKILEASIELDYLIKLSAGAAPGPVVPVPVQPAFVPKSHIPFENVQTIPPHPPIPAPRGYPAGANSSASAFTAIDTLIDPPRRFDAFELADTLPSKTQQFQAQRTMQSRTDAPNTSITSRLENIKLPSIVQKYPRGSAAATGALVLATMGVVAYAFTGKKPSSSDPEKMEILQEAIKNNSFTLPPNEQMIDNLLVLANNLKETFEENPETDPYLQICLKNTEIMSRMLKNVSSSNVNFDNVNDVKSFKEKIKKFKPNLKTYLNILKKSELLASDQELYGNIATARELLLKYNSFLDKYAPV